MLIDLQNAADQHGLTIRNVIHCGAHHGEEVDDYRRHGAEHIILVEPQPKCLKLLRKRFREDDRVQIVACAAGPHEADGTSATMYVERKNKGQSSSLLKPLKHLADYPKIKFRKRIDVPVRSLDAIMSDRPDRQQFNFISLDVQGFELEVLRGATETLEHIDAILTEINREEMYEGCPMAEDLDGFLTPYGFNRVDTNWSGGGWGDALYIKSSSTPK